MGCQKNGSVEKANGCVMIMGDGEVERDAPVDLCLQRLELDSEQVDVLNSTPEGACVKGHNDKTWEFSHFSLHDIPNPTTPYPFTASVSCTRQTSSHTVTLVTSKYNSFCHALEPSSNFTIISVLTHILEHRPHDSITGVQGISEVRSVVSAILDCGELLPLLVC